MKYNHKANIYKASNVIFNPETEVATSYDWWQFVKRINGQLVFNNYYYRSTTCKHQSKVRRLLGELGIQIDQYIEAPEGLQDIPSAIDHLKRQASALQAAIDKPRSQRRKNEERRRDIWKIHEKLVFLHEAMKKAA